MLFIRVMEILRGNFKTDSSKFYTSLVVERKKAESSRLSFLSKIDFTCPPWTSAKETTGLMTCSHSRVASVH